jgi:hypothetical protein
MVKTHQVVKHQAPCYTCNVYVRILSQKTEENLDKFIECHCIGLSLEFWKMSISAANPGCDCQTVLYIVVTPGHSKSLRQELGQVLMTTYGLLHKGGKCCHGFQRYHCLNVIFH